MSAFGDSGAARIACFAGRSTNYYRRVFRRIAETRGLAVVPNAAAALGGPLWLGARGLWAAFWAAFVIEIFAVVLIGIGLLGDLGAEQALRAERLAAQGADRLTAAQAAIAAGNPLGESMKTSALALAGEAEKATAAAEAARGETRRYIVAGAAILVALRLVVGLLGNALLAARFRRWRADPRLPHGLPAGRVALTFAILAVCYPLAVYRFAAPEVPGWLKAFPAALDLRNAVSSAIDGAVRRAAEAFAPFFTGITAAIKAVLDLMEAALVITPWPIVMVAIVAIAWQVSGLRVAIFSAAALAYLALMGFWEKSMATVALLGTAAFLCVVIGIPLGVWSGRSPRVAAVLRPVLDFMQTMPAFVYLIPVIAFFGIGKPPGVIATLVFGLPPVVRLTALGIAGVPEEVRESAKAFGASPAFLLFKVDLPLAMPSIMTGVNQTLLMCLSMVVIASLIGAKGLGEDVLSALQYAAVGQGILAGLAILACAMVLDRIVQGRVRP